ncbi:TPA: hypothetical protein VB895_002036 [Streptococcus suis]|nr:hypothetical protein [Streptococcus suis]HEP1824506.1 hypothetical protein [Streptococcus suis]HEP1829224.1 hypothetical protein [Streptococcus suis]
MTPVIAKLTELFTEIVPEAYFLSNSTPTVAYPYLIFSYDAENRNWGQDGAYVDVDIFDNKGEDQEQIEHLAFLLKRELEHRAVMLEECYIRFRFEGQGTIDTMSDVLQRRNVRFYITIDWRNKDEKTG